MKTFLLSLLSHTHAFNNDPHASITRLREIQSDAGCIKTGRTLMYRSICIWKRARLSVNRERKKDRDEVRLLCQKVFLSLPHPFSPSWRVFNFAPLRRIWMQIEMSCDDCVDDCPHVMTLSLRVYRTFTRL